MKASHPNIKEAARKYLKVVEWSDEDNCFVGSAPPIIGPACHGRTEAEVMAQLTTIVEEWIETMLRHGTPLPEGTAGKKYSGEFVVRVAPELHKAVAIKAQANNLSLNRYVESSLKRAVLVSEPNYDEVSKVRAGRRKAGTTRRSGRK